MRILVPASLLVSFAANDGEELVTMSSMPSMVADVLSRLPAPLRSLAGSRLKTLTLSRRHVQVGVATMGVLFGVAVLDGVRTAGRSRFYQDAQRIFGLHAYGHMAAALLTRGYTPGVATSPTVVLPVWWLARSRLRRAGVPDRSSLPRAALVVGSWLVLAHTLGACAAAHHIRTDVAGARTRADDRTSAGRLQ
jgi:integral membrane protein